MVMSRQSERSTVSACTPGEVVPLLIGATLGEIERELVLHTLLRCNGNRTHAARMLGLSVRTLRNKIRIYAANGIAVPACSDLAAGQDGKSSPC